MPPGAKPSARKNARPAVPVQNLPSHAVITGRKVTRTITVHAGTAALAVADAIAKRSDPPMTWEQVDPDFTAERIAGPRDTNA